MSSYESVCTSLPRAWGHDHQWIGGTCRGLYIVRSPEGDRWRWAATEYAIPSDRMCFVAGLVDDGVRCT